MDFYAQQEAARKKSAWLTVVALLFSVVVSAATGFVLTVAAWCAYLALADVGTLPGYADFINRHPAVNPLAYLLGFVIVLISELWSYARICSGNALMRMVGARMAKRSDHQTLMNVVEEMSIASGVDMPSVWVLESDRGINAFAAGRGEGDSAICVSAGALKYLVRDELQGVVAHEFGHVLNGDMRLNTHLAALVEGLSGIAGLGRGMLSPFR
jgi:Zn-dependent protease with chaperone function